MPMLEAGVALVTDVAFANLRYLIFCSIGTRGRWHEPDAGKPGGNAGIFREKSGNAATFR